MIPQTTMSPLDALSQNFDPYNTHRDWHARQGSKDDGESILNNQFRELTTERTRRRGEILPSARQHDPRDSVAMSNVSSNPHGTFEPDQILGQGHHISQKAHNQQDDVQCRKSSVSEISWSGVPDLPSDFTSSTTIISTVPNPKNLQNNSKTSMESAPADTHGRQRSNTGGSSKVNFSRPLPRESIQPVPTLVVAPPSGIYGTLPPSPARTDSGGAVSSPMPHDYACQPSESFSKFQYQRASSEDDYNTKPTTYNHFSYLVSNEDDRTSRASMELGPNATQGFDSDPPSPKFPKKLRKKQEPAQMRESEEKGKWSSFLRSKPKGREHETKPNVSFSELPQSPKGSKAQSPFPSPLHSPNTSRKSRPISSNSLVPPNLYTEDVERIEEPQVSQTSQQEARPTSLQSHYSLYSLPESIKSPSIHTTHSRAASTTTTHSINKVKTHRTAPILERSPSGRLVPASEPESPDDFLQLGIDYHEAGELEEATRYFHKSASLGSNAGKLMLAISLQHGWGCRRNEDRGFNILKDVAQTIIPDFENIVTERRQMTSAEAANPEVQSEFSLVLHEMGASSRFGWGTPKDKPMAVKYFKVSADLGDPDAQGDLAFCYANGKGTKKDNKLAAKYYRKYINQGGESFGLSWIYKDKYMDE